MSAKKHTNPAYISHVHLKGYKSIIDTEVELHPGLNIMIGPNGSGKTNFCRFISLILHSLYPSIDSKFVFSLTFNLNNENYKWRAEFKKKALKAEAQQILKIIEENFYKVSEKIPEKRAFHYNDLKEVSGKKNEGQQFIITDFNACRFIWFNSPLESLIFKETVGLYNQLSFKINKEDLNPEGLVNTSSAFVNSFISENFYFSDDLKANIFKDERTFLNYLKVDEEIVRNLKKFSPIENVRIEKGVKINENGRYYQINYLGFEFLVDGHWWTWNDLSDGTKRLFFIISEISSLNSGFCIVEEPELGIHPHQYAKLLNFLKEQAEDKQIILTTHAPRTLDILKNNELNQIMLTRYDKELGTKMRHLSKEEIEDVISYKEEDGSASELWTYTGFFDEEAII